MLLAIDQIVNQAAKWNHMLGGHASPHLTIRGIINRGGEQGAQHSQALHAWFAHVPGLRVVMPATPSDARDLLIASVLCNDPVVYIDDRWLYDERARLEPPRPLDLRSLGPQRRRMGTDLTLVGASHTAKVALQVAEELSVADVSCDVWDLRVISPLDTKEIASSVARTGRLCVIDGAWKTCGLAGEVIASVCENLEPSVWRSRPFRVTLPDAPAPSSGALESIYYLRVSSIVDQIKASLFARST
jgi:acetoin:2,6-dichlorophenolindophenol oxidoreductase subunit beta